MEVKPTVLLYNLQEGERAEKIRRYLVGEGIEIIDVLPAEYLQTLGSLLKMPGFEKVAAPNMGFSFPEEMLVMFAFTDKVMNEFFQFFRDEGIPSVGLKAAITPTNINWNSKQLYEAISEEHARIMAAKQQQK